MAMASTTIWVRDGHRTRTSSTLHSRRASYAPALSVTSALQYGRKLDDFIRARPPSVPLALSNKTPSVPTNNVSSPLHTLLSFSSFFFADLHLIEGFVDQSSPSFKLPTSSPAVERLTDTTLLILPFAFYPILIVCLFACLFLLFLLFARFLRGILSPLSGIAPIIHLDNAQPTTTTAPRVFAGPKIKEVP